MPKRRLICLLLLAFALAGSVNAATICRSQAACTRIMYTPEKLLTMGNALNVFFDQSTGGSEAIVRPAEPGKELSAIQHGARP